MIPKTNKGHPPPPPPSIRGSAGTALNPGPFSRAHQLGLNPTILLNDNGACSFFERLEDQIIIGPTRTNVNDYQIILIG